MSLPDLEELRSQQTSFVDLVGYLGYTEVNLTGGLVPLRARASRVMPGFFDTVGMQPLAGRPNLHEKGVKNVVISYETWLAVFGADDGIVGRSIELDDEDHTVVGVTPAGFDFPGGKDVWLTWDVKAEKWAGNREAYRLNVVARVSPHVTLEEAQTELDVIWQRIAEENEIDDVTGLELVPEFEQHRGKARVPLLILMGAVILVLGIISVNLAGLTFSRGIERQRELALRSALGAGRARLGRQLLTEILLLCLPGCALGLFLAYLGLTALSRLFPADSFIYLYMGGVPQLDEVRIDIMATAFALAVTLLTLLIAGLMPAYRLSKPDYQAVKSGQIASATSATGTWWRDTLVVSQMSMSLLLLLGAALLLKSYVQLVRADLGFETLNRMTAQTVLSHERYPDEESKTRYLGETTERLKAIPGVLEVVTTSNLPFSNWGFGTRIIVEGLPADEEPKAPGAEWFSVSPDFFRVLHVDVLQGRSFDSRDSSHSEKVMVIDRSLDSLLFPDGDAVGHRIRFFDEWRTVVGVVEGVRRNGPLGEARPTVYVLYHQYPTNRINWVLKTATSPEMVGTPVRERLKATDPDQPIYRVETLGDYLSFSISKNRMNSLLMSFFSLSALVVACLGLHGLLAFRVAKRTHEIGIRRALGASRANIFAMIIKRGMLLTMVGWTVGTIAALGLTRFLSSILVGVGTTDAEVFFITGGVFLLVGFAACTLPALRAVRLDPSRALRYE